MNALEATLSSQDALMALQRFYGVADWNRWETESACYYDIIYVPSAGAPEWQFFAVQAGGADPNRPAATIIKTEEYTNLPVSGQIGGAECFVPMSLHMDIYPAPKARQQVAAVAAQTTFAADQLLAARWVENLTNQGVFIWEINKNTWMEEARPFKRFPPGFGLGTVVPPVIGGVTAPINGGLNAIAGLSNRAVYGMGDIFTLDQPMFLAPNTPFTWKVQFNQNPTTVGNSTATTGLYNGAGTTHTEIGTMFAYAEMRGVKIRPMQ